MALISALLFLRLSNTIVQRRQEHSPRLGALQMHGLFLERLIRTRSLFWPAMICYRLAMKGSDMKVATWMI
ncbi:MAG: hypothetical protein CMI67_09970 [Pelagibaca sp.]|nr:hypothetical protein [Pelagibaca sp.]